MDMFLSFITALGWVTITIMSLLIVLCVVYYVVNLCVDYRFKEIEKEIRSITWKQSDVSISRIQRDNDIYIKLEQRALETLKLKESIKPCALKKDA